MEFALVFPILMALTYSAIVYGYVYTLQQAINFAAQQAAQAAVAVIPGSSTTQTSIINSTVTAALNWLPPAQLSGRLSVPVSYPDCLQKGVTLPANAIAVEVQFTVGGGGSGGGTGSNPLFPIFVLPFVGTFPVLPAKLFACAVAYQ